MIKNLYSGIFFTFVFFFYFLYLSNFDLKINNKRDKKLINKNIQFLGNPKENNIYRSFMSNHSHLDLTHLISNIIGINIISFLISDLFNWYYPLILFFFTIIIEHIFVELKNLDKSKVIGASGSILGLFGFYFFYLLFNINNFNNFSIIHQYSFFLNIIILINIIVEFKKNSKDNNDRNKDGDTSEISHLIGFSLGFINFILFFLSNYFIKLKFLI